MAAIDDAAFDRLTRHWDEDLIADLKDVAVKMYGLGYEDGLKQGAKLLAQRLAEKVG